MNNPYAQTWLRHDAALLVVFVSDENEQSQTYFSATSEFTQWYSNVRQSVFVASIVNFDPTVSLCTSTSPMNTGTEYMDATSYFGGQIIDICDEDWSAGVADASNQTAPYEHWDLSKQPLYDDRIYVFVDGSPYTDWHYEPAENRVYFDLIPPGGSLVEVAYYYE
jgi:hypothetical protein